MTHLKKCIDMVEDSFLMMRLRKVRVSEGVTTEYKIIVKCPNCKNTNKFL